VLCVLCLCVWQPLVSDGAEQRVQRIVQLIQEVRTHLKAVQISCAISDPSMFQCIHSRSVVGPPRIAGTT
jgi:hypothetical protein